MTVECKTADDVRQLAKNVCAFRQRSYARPLVPQIRKEAVREVQEIELFEPVQNIIEAPIPVVRPYVMFRATPTSDDIINTVCEFYNTRRVDIMSARRTKECVWPRQIVFYLMRELTMLSCAMMGRVIGNRDHSTAVHAIQKIDAIAKADERLRDELYLLKIKICDLMKARNALTTQKP